MKIAIVDSGVANLTSVLAALERMGLSVEITAQGETLCAADRVILPGVGSAQAAMRSLYEKGLPDVLRRLTQPVMGICLGMQLMFEASQEGAKEGELIDCLGLIKGRVQKLEPSSNEPLPHMGWNELHLTQPNHPLLKGIKEGSFVYFVHSYGVSVSSRTIASCLYGQPFTAMCQNKNFYGCQFHPERSGDVGEMILRNFVEMNV